jgi:tetratricopeptide (TPR) repeat protein
MVADDGRVVLMDFGTGRVAEDTSRSRAGTPLYLAPELLRGGQPSVRTDLYSLGVLLYRLLSGSYPVEAQNLPALHAAHDAAERPSIVRVRADLPPRLPPVIDRALDPDPGRRYESAGALASDLQRIESRRRFSSLRLVAAGVVIVVAAGAGWETYPSRRRYAVEVDTYDRYQQARALVERRGFYSPQEAVVRLEAILSDDPTFAPAQAALADAYAFLASGYRSSIDPDEALARMRRAAARAIELDPLLAEGHAAMGVVRAWEHRWEESESSFERALELDPTLTTTAISYSFWTLRPRLELDRAERLLETALEHDPFSLDVQRELAALRFSRGRYQDAIAAFERILSVQPDYPLVKQFLARAWILDGRASEGLALLDDESARGRENPHYRAQALIELGRRAEAERLAFENRGYPLRETVIYAALGDLDRAFEALERMAQVEPQRLPVHLTYPELERLRGDARLDRIRRQFRLP